MGAYEPIQMPQPESPGFSDFFMQLRAEQNKRDQQRAEMLLRQGEQDRLSRLAGAQIANYQSEAQMREAEQKRILANEKRQQGLDVANAIPKIRAMLTPGDPMYDPQSAMSLARAHGIDLSAQGKGQAPTAPAPGPTELEYGPREAEQADAVSSATPAGYPGAEGPPAGFPPSAQQGSSAAERARFAQANDPEKVAANKLAQQQYADAQLAYANRQPTYSGKSPIGDVTIDPNEAIASREFARKRQVDELSPLAGTPGLGQYGPAIQRMIAAGMKPEQIFASIEAAQKLNAKDEEQQTYHLTAEEQARHNRAMEAAAMANARARGLSAGGTIENRNDMATNRNFTTYLGTVKEFENTAGVKPDVQTMKQIQKMKAEIGDPNSPVSQTASIDTISSIAQSGKASQGVINQINSHALGPVETAEDKVHQLFHNGAHSPKWIASMKAALDDLETYQKSEQGRVMQGFEAAAGDQSPFSGPEYSSLRDSQRRKIAAAMGMEVPPPAPAQEGAMRPGSGQRPLPPSNPLLDARRKSKRADAHPLDAVDDWLTEQGY